ncbi:hypothetical protein JMJ85_10685 [Salmonella enterica subsp. diarizonae]|uniref:Uncharacterized protein n=1 Tax=Salmonella diarizonae TaxID=59204 RepID=A0A8F5N2P5_SALDZ|nr:hypothetical protein JMJ85_10685 [Salmonella enterica subsp. diarizonae]
MTMSWLETVAKNVGISVTEAEERLQKRGIFSDKTIRPTPKLTITGIRFKGYKKLVKSQGHLVLAGRI